MKIQFRLRYIVTVLGMSLGMWLPAAVAAQTPQQPVGQAPAPATFIVRPGDVLKIQVSPDADNLMTGDFIIEETGLVNLPQIGAVMVGGLTIDAVRTELRRRYREIVREAVVAITPMFPVSVLGAVAAPGVHSMRPGQTVFDAISVAGGFAPNARTKDVRLLREGANLKIDARAALESGGTDLATPLRSGDRILVKPKPALSSTAIVSVLQTVVIIASIIRGF